MLGELMWSDDIGAVGFKLLYEFGRVQHAGNHWRRRGWNADHPFRGLSKTILGMLGEHCVHRNYRPLQPPASFAAGTLLIRWVVLMM